MKNKTRHCLSCSASSIKPLCEACQTAIKQFSHLTRHEFTQGLYNGSIDNASYERLTDIDDMMRKYPHHAITNYVRIHIFHKLPHLTYGEIMLSGTRKWSQWKFEAYLTNGRYIDRLTDNPTKTWYGQRDIEQVRSEIFSLLLWKHGNMADNRDYMVNARQKTLAELRYTLTAIQESVKIDSINQEKEL